VARRPREPAQHHRRRHALWSLFTTLSATREDVSRLLLMRVGVGVGEATLSAPGVSLLADYFPRSQLARAMSIYALGVFFGSGLGYFIGAVVIGRLDVAGTLHLPVLGDIRPWQSGVRDCRAAGLRDRAALSHHSRTSADEPRRKHRRASAI
jgi:MFS family permease